MTTLSSDPRTLAYEAYVYLYPLATMEVTRRQAVNVEPGTKPIFGPPSEFQHARAFPTAELRAVVRPSFDTPPLRPASGGRNPAGPAGL